MTARVPPTPWDDHEGPQELESDAPELEVTVEPRKIVGRLLGPDGEPVALLADRPWVPFGFVSSSS